MADTVITIPNEEVKEIPQLPDSQLQMAIQFGEMKKAFETLQSEVSQKAFDKTEVLNQIEELRMRISSLHSQQAITSHQAETLKESLRDIQSEVTEDSESSENNEVVEVIPPMETKIEIEQKPASQRGMIAKFLYGK